MRLLVIVAIAFFVAPAPAFASSASVGRDGVLRYTAAPGEENDLQTSGARVVVVLRDFTATIHPGRECRAQTKHRVSCTVRVGGRAVARLGDRDDDAFSYQDAAATSLHWHVYGGPGSDSIGPLGRDDVLDCGTGGDFPVILGTEFDSALLQPDCTNVVDAAYVDLENLRAVGGRITAMVGDTVNSDPDVPYACRSGISLRAPDRPGRPGRLLGHAGFALLPRHRSSPLSFTLNTEGRAIARQHGIVVVRVLYPSTEIDSPSGCAGVPLPTEVGAVYRVRL